MTAETFVGMLLVAAALCRRAPGFLGKFTTIHVAPRLPSFASSTLNSMPNEPECNFSLSRLNSLVFCLFHINSGASNSGSFRRNTCFLGPSPPAKPRRLSTLRIVDRNSSQPNTTTIGIRCPERITRFRAPTLRALRDFVVNSCRSPALLLFGFHSHLFRISRFGFRICPHPAR